MRELDGDLNTRQRIRYRYTDEQGRWHSIDVVDGPSFTADGERVPILHDPANPKRAMLGTSRHLYGWGAGLVLLGAGLTALGVLGAR